MKSIEERLSRRARGLGPSPIRELFPYLSIPGMISLGGGYPNARTFPLADVAGQLKGGGSFRLEGPALDAACQYTASDASARLARALCTWHADKDGVSLGAGALAVLSGAQEGLFAAAYLFVNKGDRVVVSEPTYPGALAAFRAFGADFVPIPLDTEGMNTDLLGRELARMAAAGEPMPKLIYTIPSGHNPGGVSLSAERRRQMLELAGRFDLLVIEDDPYQLIRLDDAPRPPTLQSLGGEARVLRLDSFSKIFAPGLRIGYASGPAEIIRRIVLFKQAASLHTSTLCQDILACFLEEAGPAGLMERIRENCALYRENRDALIDAARDLLPPQVAYDVPCEGFFVWFRMPEQCSASGMLRRECEARKVVIVPGAAFSAGGGLDHCFRATFASGTPEEIREGVRRVAAMAAAELERAGA